MIYEEKKSDLISRENAIALAKEPISPTGDATYDNAREWEREGFVDELMELPSVDAVEVVRCKDCRHVEVEEKPIIGMWCTRLGVNGMAVWDNCFCSFGERREDGEVE